MRKGSVAIVPIMLAIMLIFWAIWFVGERSEDTKVISNVEKLQELHENAAMYAMQRKIDLLQENALKDENERLNDDEINATINQEVSDLMRKNGIDE